VWGRESSSPDIGSAGHSIRDDGQKLYHSRILETYLTDCHASILLKVGPRRIDDCDVIFLVPWQNVNGHVHLLQRCTCPQWNLLWLAVHSPSRDPLEWHSMSRPRSSEDKYVRWTDCRHGTMDSFKPHIDLTADELLYPMLQT
jgi:hypothetical protein